MGDRLAIIDMGRKLWSCAPFLGELGSRVTQRGRTKWHLDPSSRWATIDMGRKLGGAVLCPLFGRGSWVPIQHNVAWDEA